MKYVVCKSELRALEKKIKHLVRGIKARWADCHITWSSQGRAF